ncbi:hypothetical protein MULP_00889 [Mycobacterium liflandii 128FXT]|uniref:Secreted protein n=1 Tax=Mycobacterium liflandii (strain 128FXT) TaxID=459424 RepID=L7V392_MYCL1|nr:hypothetical protein MULP_00889 [Mycobacterium liflandii 128FXT]
MRAITVLIARCTAYSGSGVSAAAMVMISVPVMEKIAITTVAKTGSTPLGKSPPCEVRLPKSIW